MRIKLIDVDSKIPNLALMKLSQYYKCNNDIVGFNINNPDLIYVSIIFNKNKNTLIDPFNNNTKKIIGGSGYDLNIKLPDEIEYLKPDYSLYPDIDYSIGYTSRGCNRNCYFCIVPKKEGKFKIWQHPSEFYDKRFNKIMFLDNNILLNKEWFREVCNFCIDKKLSVWFTQGLDIRLLDKKDISFINKLKTFNMWTFAFDNIKDEEIILEKIQLLKNNGFIKSKLRNLIQFYVYIDNVDEFDSGLYRCNLLRNLNINSFVMFNLDNERSQKIKDLQRWANKKELYWNINFNEYKKRNNENQMRFK